MLLTTKAVFVSLQAGVNHNAQRVLLQGQLTIIIRVAGGQVFQFKNVNRCIERKVDGGIKLVGIRF